MRNNDAFGAIVHNKYFRQNKEKTQRDDFSNHETFHQALCQKLMRQNQSAKSNKITHQLPFKQGFHSGEIGIHNLNNVIS